MSHAQGIIFSKEEKIPIAYFEYDGTSDVCISHLYQTMDEVHDNWRKGQWLKCVCKQDPISCYIYSDYGSGFYWEGEVCIKCRAIVSGFEPEDSHNGRPDGKTTNYQSIMEKLPYTENPIAVHQDW